MRLIRRIRPPFHPAAAAEFPVCTSKRVSGACKHVTGAGKLAAHVGRAWRFRKRCAGAGRIAGPELHSGKLGTTFNRKKRCGAELSGYWARQVSMPLVSPSFATTREIVFQSVRLVDACTV